MHKCKVMESHLELLNIWITRNYNREKERLSLRYGMYFSEDIFIESYMLARNEIKHCDICNKEMSEVLMDCYKRISYKYYVQKMRYVNPDQLFFDFLKDDDEYKDEYVFNTLYDNILRFVRNKHRAIYDEFKLNFIEGIEIKVLAKKRGVPLLALKRKLDRVKREIKNKYCYDYFQ